MGQRKIRISLLYKEIEQNLFFFFSQILLFDFKISKKIGIMIIYEKRGDKMEATFQSEQELYQHVMPALHAKRMDLKRHQLPYIKEEDIWNYLKEKEWVQKKNLELYHIVSDIMNCDEVKLDDYFKTILERKRRRPIL